MPDPRSSLAEGTAPDGLEVLRLIGRGAMGGVYLARDQRLGRLVAVKVLREELARDDVSRQRFVREAQAAARISHPHVTQVHDVGELDSGVPYIVMEHVDGRNLADVIASEGPLEVDTSRKLLVQIARALEAAHERGVVHRDVKPANVILQKDGARAVLTDFGVAGIVESGTETVQTLTRIGERIGDPRYMSPEQHRGEPVGEASDVYSLAVVGYEMLTCHSPFGGDVPADASTPHLRRVPLDLHEVREDVPPALSEQLRRCLAKKPEQRPGIARLLQSLEGPHEEPETAAAGNSLARFFAELKKRRVYQAAAAYLAAMIVVLQTLDVIFPRLPLSDWVFTALVAISLGAFPVVIVLAWIFDFREGRITRTGETGPGPGRVALYVLQFAGLAVSGLLAYGVARWVLS